MTQTEEVTIETEFEPEEPATEQPVTAEPEQEVSATELTQEQIDEFMNQTQKKAPATYRERMLDVAFALHNRMEQKARGEFFTKKQFAKRKKANKLSKKSRKNHR